MIKRLMHARVRIVVALVATFTTAAVALSASGPPPMVGRAPSEPPPIPADAFTAVIVPSASRLPDRPASVESRPPSRPDDRPEAAIRRVPSLGARTPTATPAAPAPPSGSTHRVSQGDTLWQIAAWHRADLALILRWNDVDARRLAIGQRLVVAGGRKMTARPGPGGASAPKAASPVSRSPAGDHDWPLAVRGTISRGFSAAHPALDIAAQAGTAVRAIASGTVAWAGWKNNGGGYVVVIHHPDGMTSTYNHNRAVAVRRGEQVAAGQRIASVGATGLATGPHLDLRIEMGGRLVNPLGLL